MKKNKKFNLMDKYLNEIFKVSVFKVFGAYHLVFILCKKEFLCFRQCTL